MSDYITLWRPEHPAGHQPFCARPSHGLNAFCAADEREPRTMQGKPSQAWLTDHPEATEEWIEELQARVATAEQDVVGGWGQEAWEGGASDVIRSVVEISGAPAKAISEVLRMEGALPSSKLGTDGDYEDLLFPRDNQDEVDAAQAAFEMKHPEM